MQILTFHFQKYLTKARFPEQGATISFVIYPMLISSFPANFLPEHITDPRGDLNFSSRLTPVQPSLLESVVFFSLKIPPKVLEWYIYTLLISVPLLGFFSSVRIINNFLSALVFSGPFFLNYAGCESQKDSVLALLLHLYNEERRA